MIRQVWEPHDHEAAPDIVALLELPSFPRNVPDENHAVTRRFENQGLDGVFRNPVRVLGVFFLNPR